jgi:hypothetical protein
LARCKKTINDRQSNHSQPIGDTHIFMNNSDEVSDTTTPRPTLKLKVAPRKPPVEAKPAPIAKQESKASQKPGARWSDDYTRAMQQDMDRLKR